MTRRKILPFRDKRLNFFFFCRIFSFFFWRFSGRLRLKVLFTVTHHILSFWKVDRSGLLTFAWPVDGTFYFLFTSTHTGLLSFISAFNCLLIVYRIRASSTEINKKGFFLFFSLLLLFLTLLLLAPHCNFLLFFNSFSHRSLHASNNFFFFFAF